MDTAKIIALYLLSFALLLMIVYWIVNLIFLIQNRGGKNESDK